MGQLPHLNSLWKDENAKGLVVISVTDEPAELVIPWLEANGVTHPVVILPDGALEAAIGVKAFPTSAVFVGNEKQWTGSPSSSNAALSKARKGAKKSSVYPKKLSKVIKSIQKGDMVKAMLDLQKTLEKLEGEDAAWAGRLEISLMNQCSRAFAASAKSIEDGFWLEGLLKAQPYLGKGSTYPSVAETRERFSMLKGKGNYSKEISGGELYLKGQALERGKEYTDAVKAYKSILKKFADTQIAGHARTAAEKLIEGKRPGFKASCEACKRMKGAACNKHHEVIKL